MCTTAFTQNDTGKQMISLSIYIIYEWSEIITRHIIYCYSDIILWFFVYLHLRGVWVCVCVCVGTNRCRSEFKKIKKKKIKKKKRKHHKSCRAAMITTIRRRCGREEKPVRSDNNALSALRGQQPPRHETH